MTTAPPPHRHHGGEDDRRTPNGGGPRRQRRPLQWLLVSSSSSASAAAKANDDMVVEFHTTNGQCLHIDENGRGDVVSVTVSDDEYDPATTTTTKSSLCSSSSAHQFRLFRSRDHVLWLVQSTTLDTYLAIDNDDTALSSSSNILFHELEEEDPHLQHQPQNLPLLCRATPHYWKFDPHHLRLYGTDETPRSRCYYRRYHRIQTVHYARQQRERYLQQFRRGTRQLSIRQALEAARDLDGLPFAGGGEGIAAEPDSSNTNNNCHHVVDLRTVCFATAEALRHAGHPDWVQLIGLIYHLGRTAVLLDDNDDNDDNDNNMVSSSLSGDIVWQHAVHARVLGVPIPESFCQTYPECKDSNNDDDLTISYERHMGLLSPDLVLSWTGPEYLYHMIRYNVLRLASLIDWHSHAAYRELENEDDVDVREFVHECADLLLHQERTILRATTMDDSCEALWDTHYGRIVAKYQADGLMSW
jgi:hypothetical protein